MDTTPPIRRSRRLLQQEPEGKQPSASASIKKKKKPGRSTQHSVTTVPVEMTLPKVAVALTPVSVPPSTPAPSISSVPLATSVPSVPSSTMNVADDLPVALASRSTAVTSSAPSLTPTTWLRSAKVGTVLQAVPENLCGKTCAVSSYMAFLATVFSDEMIGKLRQGAMQDYHLQGASLDQQQLIGEAWLRLRDSFCNYQIMLRDPLNASGDPTLLLVEFIEALYVFGFYISHRDTQILQALPLNILVNSAQDRGFLLGALEDASVPQIEIGVLIGALNFALGTHSAESLWQGSMNQRIRYKYDIGKVGSQTLQGESSDAGEPCFAITVPLKAERTEQSPVSLQDYLQHNLIGSASEGRKISQVTADGIFDNAEDRIRRDRSLSASECSQLLAELAELRRIPWDEATSCPQTSQTQFHIAHGNDGVCLRLALFQPDNTDVLTEGDLHKFSAVAAPKQLNILPKAQFRTMKEFFFERQEGQGPDLIYQVLPVEHGIRSRLSHDLYQVCDIPVANLHPLQLTNKEGHMVTSMELNGQSVPALFQVMECDQANDDYRAEVVADGIANEMPYSMAVVLDALVGNVNVASSRLAVASQDDGLGEQEKILCRTDFTNCMGYSRVGGKRPSFGDDASRDLLHLKETMHVSDEHIRDGIALLANVTDDVLIQLISRHCFDPFQQPQLLQTLSRRRNSLLAMEQFRPEPQAFKDMSLDITVQAQGKSHQEAVKAVTAMNGTFALPEVYHLGQKIPYTAGISAMVCHMGEAMHSGHFIEVHENLGEWFVADDREPGQALLLSDYLRCHGLTHYINPERPNGWVSLTNMLARDPRCITPMLVFARREGCEPRPEWTEAFSRQRLTSWQTAIEQAKAEQAKAEQEQRVAEQQKKQKKDTHSLKSERSRVGQPQSGTVNEEEKEEQDSHSLIPDDVSEAYTEEPFVEEPMEHEETGRSQASMPSGSERSALKRKAGGREPRSMPKLKQARLAETLSTQRSALMPQESKSRDGVQQSMDVPQSPQSQSMGAPKSNQSVGVPELNQSMGVPESNQKMSAQLSYLMVPLVDTPEASVPSNVETDGIQPETNDDKPLDQQSTASSYSSALEQPVNPEPPVILDKKKPILPNHKGNFEKASKAVKRPIFLKRW